MKNLTKEKLETAIIKCNGIKTGIQEMLNIKSHNTLNGYIKRWNLQDFIDSQVETINDQTEHNIYKWITEGNEKVTLWWAERRMFNKYGAKQTVINENHEPIKIIVQNDSQKKIIDNL